MKILALAGTLKARARAILSKWTDTDCKAYRTCGFLLLLLTATIVLPPVLVQLANRGGFFRELWIVMTRERSGPDSGWGNMMVGYALPGMMALFLVGVLGTLSGTLMLKWAGQLQDSTTSPLHIRRRCRYLLFGLLALLILPLLFPRRIFEFSMFAPMGLYLMEGSLVIPHAMAVLPLGFVTLIVAKGIVSIRPGETPSAFAGRVQAVGRAAKANIYRWLDTDTKAYRACSIVSFLFAAVLVLPVVWFQVSTMIFQGRMTTLVDIWLTGGKQVNSFAIIPTLLMLLIVLGAATMAVVAGKRMLAKSKQLRETAVPRPPSCFQGKRILQRFAWLLLAIIPATTALTSDRSVSLARQLNLSKLFASIDPSTSREARATFLSMQFFPLLLLGLVALALTISMPSQPPDSAKPSE